MYIYYIVMYWCSRVPAVPAVFLARVWCFSQGNKKHQPVKLVCFQTAFASRLLQAWLVLPDNGRVIGRYTIA